MRLIVSSVFDSYWKSQWFTIKRLTRNPVPAKLPRYRQNRRETVN